MRKFFVEAGQISDNYISIQGNDVNHIKNVLRLNLGEKLEVSSEGFNYLCRIGDIFNDKINLKILSKYLGSNESSVDIILYQALAKGSKMDLIVQKGTEIGIKDFYGLFTDRTIVKVKNMAKERAKVTRWNIIASEAAKQSKRDYIPSIKGLISFNEMLKILSQETNIIVPYEDEDNSSIGSALENIKEGRINLVIGPEGGFEPHEIEKLRKIGGKIVSLGPRILRTETAGFVAATIILYHLGNVGVI